MSFRNSIGHALTVVVGALAVAMAGCSPPVGGGLGAPCPCRADLVCNAGECVYDLANGGDANVGNDARADVSPGDSAVIDATE